MKPLIGNILATVIAILVGAGAVYASLKYLKEPATGMNWAAFLDWAVLIFSGLIAGIIAFITVWGHFQKDPNPEEAQSNV